jgi:integrase
MLRITDEGEHTHKGQRNLKTTKKGSGRRRFPIPKPLLDLNFLAYVEAIKAQGETALFPKLRTKGDRGLLFPVWGEWWSLYLREKEVLPKGGGRKPSREFRHNWATAARASGLPREAIEYIQGHSTAGASANEGYGSREPLGWHIDKLHYEGLDLSGVKPWA